ncbi:S1 domain-containing RNA-binding protein [Colibacter massiliensis]|uniref:S1 domain-containing RNA-binding protein n=2 Tax=Colibacter massiliensis TaxID=1852379 RepID=UPI002356A5B2|nr:S1 domain-containing RNA-binding protein [Colibacter massiliensis]
MAIETGNVLEGIVTGITKFGAFVELPEKKVGLVHISEVANEYVKDVHDFLEVGEKVSVKVLSVDDTGKVGLSIKQSQENESKKELRRRAGMPASFEDQLSRFLKDSEARLSDLKRNTESKRGGRGARRAN